MPKFPHVPKRRDPLYPHTPKGQVMPQTFIEGGQPVPPEYRYLIGWVDEPLPEYSLMTIEAEPGERKIDAVMKQLKDGVDTIQRSENFTCSLLPCPSSTTTASAIRFLS